jgi:hypothetical protein
MNFLCTMVSRLSLVPALTAGFMGLARADVCESAYDLTRNRLPTVTLVGPQ